MVKIAIGSVAEGVYMETEVHGRDSFDRIAPGSGGDGFGYQEAMAGSIKGLVEGVKDMLETTPPEILSDIMHRGITLSGGGALIPGLESNAAKSSKNSGLRGGRSALGGGARHGSYFG